MSAPLTARYHEPLSTMDTTRPLPIHLARLGPCGGCGSSDPKRWRYNTRDQLWLCQCYWHPEMRWLYRKPEAVSLF